jgi:hypothetical protein
MLSESCNWKPDYGNSSVAAPSLKSLDGWLVGQIQRENGRKKTLDSDNLPYQNEGRVRV